MSPSDSRLETPPKGSGPTPTPGNADAPWDEFDSDAYFQHNYGELRKDDARIIEIIADFFQGAFPHARHTRQLARAIDVGSGTNLYPALTMMPYSSQVTLFERAFTNREWLKRELQHPSESWETFWTAIASGRTAYDKFRRPLEVLHGRAHVEKGSVFSLPVADYDMGTMFFVAESITTRNDEFERAAQAFVNSLVPGAPFAAAFMRNSSGYIVGDQRFPACMIDKPDVLRALAPVARTVHIETVESNDLRDGYSGMMVATGRKK
ncbi:SCO2525 family SAM-dependent methyltransferase [Actinoplanes sp. NPDC049596]|uniref:SCO2525 family SAM-dependent methyltransferase n=1 Tax=unclassified Actinoplanes TaxID=2626549 RepID=UPI0034422E72